MIMVITTSTSYHNIDFLSLAEIHQDTDIDNSQVD
ncbi:unnamed protein product [Schistosoma margrebowiei]|uniref:Uncharacterized protein n=1 Tax=Schistosoma margrebowiei TaxID=48269 RepID=A0A183MU45_9TREM|nr:unnamed protein product [Schistosoma margrebowiei]